MLQPKTLNIISWIALGVAFSGAILSTLDICTGGCNIAHQYRIFGLPFAIFGIAFMTSLIIMHWLSLREKTGPINALYTMALFSAVGAEMKFIHVQKYEIGAWCPICICIAIAVCVLATLQLVKGGFHMRIKSTLLRNFAKTSALTLAAVIGFAVSVIGIQAPVMAAPAPDAWFGKKSSPVTVYIASDWYCSHCRIAEPQIESALQELGKTAKYTFIDYPLTRASFSIMPYHIGLLEGDKKRYLAGRQALLALTARGGIPNTEQVKIAFAKKGIILRTPEMPEQIRYAQEFGSTIKEHGIRLTPTVVVVNKKTGKKQIIEGSQDITRTNILAAVKAVGGR